MLYVFQGEIEAAGTALKDGQMGVLGDGDTIAFTVPETATGETHMLLLGGVPLNEPVVQHGPFVMNTEAEISQAIRDYQMGRMGQIQHS